MTIYKILLFTLGFSIGSIPTGYLLGRMQGIDLRKYGSGNIGATNAKRILGNKFGLYTLIGDVAKGMISVYLPYLIITDPAMTNTISPIQAVSGLGAILGHCFSPFLKFKGGKGIATSLGVFIILAPLQTFIAVIIFFTFYKISRFVSLSAIAATISLLISLIYSSRENLNAPLVYVVTITAITVIAKHRSNIARLISGKEVKT